MFVFEPFLALKMFVFEPFLALKMFVFEPFLALKMFVFEPYNTLFYDVRSCVNKILLINKIFVKQGERAPQNALNTAKFFQTLGLAPGLRYLV